MRVLKLYLLLITLTVLRITESSRKSLSLDFSDVFLMIRLDLCVLERKTTEVKHHFLHIILRVHAINMTYDC